MKKADLQPKVFHVILAGNSSQSPIVRQCFQEKIDRIMADNPAGDRIILHAPILPDPANPEAPTLKTGVAIGLLNSLPGEPMGMINRGEKGGETAFPYTVGRLKQGKLSPLLKRGANYVEWTEFGRVLDEGVNKFFYSANPMALTGDLPRDQCREGRLSWGAANAGKTILVKATAPDAVVFALAGKANAPDEKNQIEIKLRG
ncbi:MAG: hypothetical protein K2H64_05320 [Desulfovibrio sp.]|nr:hypothetical protein [Desulfovibrio sp.]